jgi:hypothetical protein
MEIFLCSLVFFFIMILIIFLVARGTGRVEKSYKESTDKKQTPHDIFSTLGAIIEDDNEGKDLPKGDVLAALPLTVRTTARARHARVFVLQKSRRTLLAFSGFLLPPLKKAGARCARLEGGKKQLWGSVIQTYPCRSRSGCQNHCYNRS